MSGQNIESLEVNGRLTMETVPALFEKGLRQLQQGDLHADLSKVEAVDSAAISMLLGWKRAAQSNDRELSVVGWPDELLSLARLYGVDDLLPMHEE